MPTSSTRTRPTDSRQRDRRRWWRVLASTAALILAATGATAISGPAHAQADCLTVESQFATWAVSPDSGGFHGNITITNTCATAIPGWTLVLTSPPGHTFQQGWNANWTVAGSTLTATPRAWSVPVRANASIVIGYLGTWTGSPQEPACTINGQPCDEPPGPAPEVVLTSPTEGSFQPSVCAARLTAEASAGTGTIDRVEFYVNSQLVGSDDSAPYGVDVPASHPALSGVAQRHTAFARVVTTSPVTAADSQTVTFGRAPPPPALMVIACPSRVELAEGATTSITFVTVCSGTPGLNLTVTGDAGVSIDPTSSPPGSREHRVTVTAAAGSAGAVARIDAQSEPAGCLPASAVVTVVPST